MVAAGGVFTALAAGSTHTKKTIVLRIRGRESRRARRCRWSRHPLRRSWGRRAHPRAVAGARSRRRPRACARSVADLSAAGGRLRRLVTDTPAAASFSGSRDDRHRGRRGPSGAPGAHAQARPAARSGRSGLQPVSSDSELARANAPRRIRRVDQPGSSRGSWVRARRPREMTDGRVDPTLGVQLWRRVRPHVRTRARARELARRPEHAPRPTWEDVDLDDAPPQSALPRGAELDLGATAKALAADEAATAIAAVVRNRRARLARRRPCGRRGRPAGGWPVLIADDHATPIGSGGPDGRRRDRRPRDVEHRRSPLADRRGGGAPHHRPAHLASRRSAPGGRSASRRRRAAVANVAATTAIILGDAAHDWLAQRRLPARCVRRDGSVVAVAGWPAEVRAA